MRVFRFLAVMVLAGLPAAAVANEDHGHGHEHGLEPEHEHGHEHGHSHGHDEAGDSAADHGHGHLATLDGLRLVHAWTRATTGRDALIFIEIENTGDETRMLSGARAEIAETAEIVAFDLRGGTGTYVPIPVLPITSGTRMTLMPEGLAIRLSGLNRDLNRGETLPMVLRFGPDEVTVSVAIEEKDATQHSHAGHAH